MKRKPIKEPEIPGNDEWRAKDDMRTLMSAEEIKRDSSRHRAAKAQAKKQMQMAARVARLEKEPL